MLQQENLNIMMNQSRSVIIIIVLNMRSSEAHEISTGIPLRLYSSSRHISDFLLTVVAYLRTIMGMSPFI